MTIKVPRSYPLATRFNGFAPSIIERELDEEWGREEESGIE